LVGLAVPRHLTAAILNPAMAALAVKAVKVEAEGTPLAMLRTAATAAPPATAETAVPRAILNPTAAPAAPRAKAATAAPPKTATAAMAATPEPAAPAVMEQQAGSAARAD